MNTHLISPLLMPQHPQQEGCVNFPFEDPKVIQRLVNNLKYLFHINSGDDITFVLSHGQCATNDQALTLWIKEQLNTQAIGMDAVLGFLVSRLQEVLTMGAVQ